MASPRVGSICCGASFPGDVLNTTSDDERQQVVLGYSILCLVSSTLGISGAIYQLWFRRSNLLRNVPEAIVVQNSIFHWLALADGLASFGVLIRSCVWIGGYGPNSFNDNHLARLVCVLCSSWIQFFYLCTFYWMVCFAVDMYRKALDKKSYLCSYHLVSWGLPLVTTTVGEVLFNYPFLQNHDHPLKFKLVHYLSFYVPILVVMIANPLIFRKSSKLESENLSKSVSYDEEKVLVSEVDRVFFSIALVFYACWLPDLVDAILHPIAGIPPGVHVVLWQIMALLNPAQAFFNSFLFDKIATWPLSHLTQPSNSSGGSQISHTFDEEIDENLSACESGIMSEESSDSSRLLIFS